MSEEEKAEAVRRAANAVLLIKVIKVTGWIVAGTLFTYLINDTLNTLQKDPYKSNLDSLMGR